VSEALAVGRVVADLLGGLSVSAAAGANAAGRGDLVALLGWREEMRRELERIDALLADLSAAIQREVGATEEATDRARRSG
jgi:hypothetical protein